MHKQTSADPARLERRRANLAREGLMLHPVDLQWGEGA